MDAVRGFRPVQTAKQPFALERGLPIAGYDLATADNHRLVEWQERNSGTNHLPALEQIRPSLTRELERLRLAPGFDFRVIA